MNTMTTWLHSGNRRRVRRRAIHSTSSIACAGFHGNRIIHERAASDDNSGMDQTVSFQRAADWSEARRRAETYLRALHGRFGTPEREQVTRAIAAAWARQNQESESHPVTLVMKSLFDLVPAPSAAAPLCMTPPIRRMRMLPEKTEFP